jgi:predicted porin
MVSGSTGWCIHMCRTRNVASGSVSPKIHAFGLMADYNLSRRTGVYVQGEYRKVTGDSTKAVLDNALI